MGFTCSNCKIIMPPDYFIVHLKYEELKLKQKQIIQYEIYEKILDGLIKTELFCITCCIRHTNNICSSSKIPIKEYCIGYTHNK
jgi:hypothetical protein